MGNIKKINSNSIKKIVKKHFSDNDFLLPEHKIDNIIKEYLFERSDSENNDYGNKLNFSKNSVESLQDIILTLSEIKDDLEIIMEKESDVLIYTDQYTDEVLNNYITELNNIITGLEDISQLTNNKESEDLD
jgi:oligoribonuclease NrnB/cAMP/cGMP phosphodiesterase (DHH superfamily)